MTPPRPQTPIVLDAARLEPALRRYFRRRAHPDEVDDLIQEVFVHLHRRRSTEAIEDVDRYVFVVAGNVLMRRHRKQHRWSRVLPTEEHDVDEAVSPEQALLGKDRLNTVIALLDTLPTRTRQIFYLHRFEDMTYPLIASTLGISQSAVEKHMIRAIKALHGLREQ